ncbi:HNH endonuclease [Candidatus Saccharibacteria bacterium]|nr:HNH endonuclease [Candidatus Saccharibacteria bacterium]
MNVRRRRVTASVIMLLVSLVVLLLHPENYQPTISNQDPITEVSNSGVLAISVLDTLEVKGRAAKTGYSREQFGDDWASNGGCDTRNIILARDMTDIRSNECEVTSGTLEDPYTGAVINFVRGPETSAEVQIDHVVALSNAWQTGAAYWTYEKRVKFANDPLELLAVDGDANQAKSDGDAATWLPSNKPFRCQYVARQVAVKHTYGLWVTKAEYDAIQRILQTCPTQALPQ